MWREGEGYDAGVFAVGGGGLEALTEAAVGVDERGGADYGVANDGGWYSYPELRIAHRSSG